MRRSPCDVADELSLPPAGVRDIESWVLSLGEFVRVIAPEELRDAARERHRKVELPIEW